MGKDYKNLPHRLISVAINSNYHIQKCLAMFLQNNEDPLLTKEALTESFAVLDDTVCLLEELARGLPKHDLGSRLPKGFYGKSTTDEMIATIQTSLDILAIETEILLKKTLEVSDEDYAHRTGRVHDLIRIMGYLARFLKMSVQSRDPGEWTADLEIQFEKFLKIRP